MRASWPNWKPSLPRGPKYERPRGDLNPANDNSNVREPNPGFSRDTLQGNYLYPRLIEDSAYEKTKARMEPPITWRALYLKRVGERLGRRASRAGHWH